jgi:hypothetical protein
VAPTTISPAITLLSARLSNDIPRLKGWSVTTTPSGGWTVNTPRGRVIVPHPDHWPAKAEAVLERLQDKGLDTQLAKLDGGGKSAKPRRTNGHQVAFSENEKTPPAYPGDPSPDDGHVVRSILLTPKIARELVERDWQATTSDGRQLKQRPLERDSVDYFSELLRSKKFLKTYQGLGIGLNGSLYDGQHRCWAIIETGISVEMNVAYNLHPDLVLALDSGRQRRASTKLAMESYKHALDLGSTARLTHHFFEYELACQLGDDDGVLVKDWRKWCNTRVNDLVVDDIVHTHPQIYEELLWAMEHKHARKDGFRPPSVAALRFLAKRAWPGCETKLDAFLLAVLENIGIDTTDHPAITLQRWLDKHGPKQGRRYMREAQLFALIKAWNLYANPPKKPVRSFAEHLGNAFPLPYSPKPTK